MNKIELAEYDKTIAQLMRCLAKYERKLFKLKQLNFNNSTMVRNFYRHAESDLKSAQHNIKHAYHLHTSLLNFEDEKTKDYEQKKPN